MILKELRGATYYPLVAAAKRFDKNCNNKHKRRGKVVVGEILFRSINHEKWKTPLKRRCHSRYRPNRETYNRKEICVCTYARGARASLSSEY